MGTNKTYLKTAEIVWYWPKMVEIDPKYAAQFKKG